MSAWEALKTLVPGLSRECRRLGEALDFETFVVGCRFQGTIPPEEQEAPRRYLNGGVGAYLSRLWRHRRVDFKLPEVRFQLGLADGSVELEIASAYLRGRYRKLVRGIPQSRWPCRRCRGEGCDRCDGRGRLYADSVEEWIARPVLTATGGAGTRIHCMGREDIDARMLGKGRPFVLEVLEPHRRSPDAGALATRIAEGSTGCVEVLDLHWGGREDVAAVKQERAEKTYRAVVSCDGTLPADFAERIESLSGQVVHQRTPSRVDHRRADLVRERTPRSIEVEADVDPTGADTTEAVRFAVVIRADAGMYIKEFISGDDGRSEPSVTAAVGVRCRCVALDVLDVHASP